jgi:hypothetical protein
VQYFQVANATLINMTPISVNDFLMQDTYTRTLIQPNYIAPPLQNIAHYVLQLLTQQVKQSCSGCAP